MTEPFSFNISLSVLNHLGRDLYRNFITVLGEAISNSWDAEAKNIWIEINKNQSYFLIKDDGKGMNDSDFREKFLKVGYSKRRAGEWISPHKKRPYIGRKGIGKIALLSCAQKIHILSKTSNTDYIGGIIDNEELNKAIDGEDNTETKDYKLAPLEENVFKGLTSDHKHGTILYFENVKEDIINSIDILRKLIALHFRFSLIDPSFSIFVNKKKISFDDIRELSDRTEFLWTINEFKDPFFEILGNKKEHDNIPVSNINIRGFIASVAKPSNLGIFGSGEKAGIDIFVNGRLRETDVLRHMPDFETRVVASYLYGQIHLDILDDKNSEDNEDVFQTNRENIKLDSKIYQRSLNIIKSEILALVSDQWQKWRVKNKTTKSKSLTTLDKGQNSRKKDFVKRIYQLKNLEPSIKASLEKEIGQFSSNNMHLYLDLFILENTFRKFLELHGIRDEHDLRTKFPDDKEVANIIKRLLELKRGRAKKESGHDLSKIVKNDCDLNYLDLESLGILVDKINKNNSPTIKSDIIKIKPVRNVVMHTNEVSQEVVKWKKIEDTLINFINALDPKP